MMKDTKLSFLGSLKTTWEGRAQNILKEKGIKL